MEERFYQFKKFVEEAFYEDNFTAVKLLAEEYLLLAEDFKTNWNYGMLSITPI